MFWYAHLMASRAPLPVTSTCLAASATVEFWQEQCSWEIPSFTLVPDGLKCPWWNTNDLVYLSLVWLWSEHPTLVRDKVSQAWQYDELLPVSWCRLIPFWFWMGLREVFRPKPGFPLKSARCNLLPTLDHSVLQTLIGKFFQLLSPKYHLNRWHNCTSL